MTALTNSPSNLPTQSDQPTSTPYESIPELANDELYVLKMARLRELRTLKDLVFNDKETANKPLGEYEVLKRECDAMQLTVGRSSVAYIDMRLSHVPGGVDRGKVTGAEIVRQIAQRMGTEPTREQLLAICNASKECDVQELVNGGISPVIVAASKSPDKPRADDSTKVEWIKKGKMNSSAPGSTSGGVQ